MGRKDDTKRRWYTDNSTDVDSVGQRRNFKTVVYNMKTTVQRQKLDRQVADERNGNWGRSGETDDLIEVKSGNR